MHHSDLPQSINLLLNVAYRLNHTPVSHIYVSSPRHFIYFKVQYVRFLLS